MSVLHGYDVSHYQGSGIPSGSYTFLGIKATEGSGYTDPTVASHRSKARAKGVVPIFYHFARPEQSSAASQAKRLVNAAGAKKGELLCLDLEASKLSQAKTNAWAKAFGSALRKYAPGIKTVLYAGAGYAANNTGRGLHAYYDYWWYPRYASMSATTRWPSACNPRVSGNTTGWARPHIWQFTPAFSGRFDANVSLLTKAQLTGASAPAPTTTKPATPPGGNDLYQHYASLSVSKPLVLKPNVWSGIGWQNVASGPTKPGNAGIVYGPCHYDIKVRYLLRGLPKGAQYGVRLVEAMPDGKGGWKYGDTVALAQHLATGGDELQMIVSGPDTMGKGSRVWLHFAVGNVSGVKLISAQAKAVYG